MAANGDARLHIDLALRAVVDVRFTSGLTELVRLGAPTVAVGGLLYFDGSYDYMAADHWIAQVRQLRTLWASLPLIGYMPVTATAVRQGLAAVRAGVDELALRGTDPLPQVITRLLTIPGRRERTAEIVRHVLEAAGPLPDGALRLLQYCIEHATDRLSIERIAADMGVSRRTLGNRLKDTPLPSPEPLIMWTRLLVAAWLLRDPHRSINQTARSLGFQELSGFRSLAMSYLRQPATSLREPGSIARVAARMVDAGSDVQRADQMPEGV